MQRNPDTVFRDRLLEAFFDHSRSEKPRISGLALRTAIEAYWIASGRMGCKHRLVPARPHMDSFQVPLRFGKTGISKRKS